MNILDQTDESLYTYFIDNQQTSGHQSVVIGVREMNATESLVFCSNSSISTPPVTDERYVFTFDYELRLYTSACYYLDEYNQWQSEGMLVRLVTHPSYSFSPIH
jgi:hypothetical protein